MRTIRTVIADDERLAREKIRALLAADGEIEVVAECANGVEAVAAVRKQKPDLLLLDVEMPGASGFEVLKRLRDGRLPVVVFITAHDEYAVRAFEVEAVDYVMKPFDRRRFDDALRRAKRHLGEETGESEARLLRLLETMVKPPRALDHFVVKERDRTFLVGVGDVDWIEAEGKYVRLHLGGASHLVRESITDVEQRLDMRKFLRIHRGTIVNVKRIQEMHRGFGGGIFVVLKDGTKLTMSRRYRTHIREVAGLDV
ncbi:MAG TPA: LytTR family DNA-binding domain-containing protein [Thermoanaerobaculia bacterium]|nr:LytTR family DNA-binding domain-containing protein [Thermoanaerobaculia bacterium]